ncbi:MAG: SdrD B-like domain-containing protein [Thermoguttaceae bacterium]
MSHVSHRFGQTRCASGILSRSSFLGERSRTRPSRRSLRFEPLEVRSLLSVGVSGIVWNDANGNGMHDAGEAGVAGVVVEIYQPSFAFTNSYPGHSLPDVWRGRAMTDADGRYAIDGLPEDVYLKAIFRTPQGYSITTAQPDKDTGIDNDAWQSGATQIFPLKAGETETLDAGLIGGPSSGAYAFSVGAQGVNTFANGIATDASGNYYVTGSFSGSVDFDPGVARMELTSVGKNDVFVAKYTSAGSLVWAKQVGNVGYDFGQAIAVGADGGVYVTGSFVGAVDFNPAVAVSYNIASVGGSDAFVLKLNADGDFAWAATWGNADAGVARDDGSFMPGDYGNDIVVGNDGSVYALSEFNITFTSATLDSLSAGVDPVSPTAYVTKIDSSGNVLWTHQDPCISQIALASDGSLYTAGSSISKLDGDGNVVWSKPIHATDIATAPDGSVYAYSVTGSTATLCMLDSSGNTLWSETGASLSDAGYDLAVGPDGILYLACDRVTATSVTEGSTLYEQDYIVTAFGEGGAVLWSDIMTGQYEQAQTTESKRSYQIGLAAAADGVYLTGHFLGSVTFDGVTLNAPSGSTAAFLCKLRAAGAPTDIAISSSTIADNLPADTTIGRLSAVSDPAGAFAYALVDGEGSDDNGAFVIRGDLLLTTAIFNASVKDSYSIRVRATNYAGESVERVLTIGVTDGAPTVAIDCPAMANTKTPTVTVMASDFNSGVPDGAVVTVVVHSPAAVGPVATGTGTMVGGKATITWASPLPDGRLSLQVEVSDGAGHVGRAYASMTVDTTPPSITIGDPQRSKGTIVFPVTYKDAIGLENITLKASDVAVSWTGSAHGAITIRAGLAPAPEDPGGGAFLIDGYETVKTVWYVELHGITGEGTASISIAAGTASDPAGNLAAAAGPTTPIDIGAATFALTGPTSGRFTAGQEVPITWTALYVCDGEKISLWCDKDTIWGNGNERWIEVDGVTAAEGQGSYRWNTAGLAPGVYYISGYLFSGGKPIYSHLVQPITLDASPSPTFALTGPSSGTFNVGDKVSIHWSAGNLPDGSTISLCCDTDAGWGGGKEKWIKVNQTAANGDGTYQWDTAGMTPGTYYIGGYVYSGGKPTYSHLTQAITLRGSQPTFSLNDATSTVNGGTFTGIDWTTANVPTGATVSICYDQDKVWNGNEKWLLVDRPVSSGGGLLWDLTTVAPGTYYLGGYLYADGKPTYSHRLQPITVQPASSPFLSLDVPQTNNLVRSATFTVGETICPVWLVEGCYSGSTVSICYSTANNWTGGEQHWIVVDKSTYSNHTISWNTTGMTPGVYYLGGYLYANGKPTYARLSQPIQLLDPASYKMVELHGVVRTDVAFPGGGHEAELTVGGVTYLLDFSDPDLSLKAHELNGLAVVVRGIESQATVGTPQSLTGVVIRVTDLKVDTSAPLASNLATSAVDQVFAEIGA